jgi:hypothetical protein
MQGDHQNEKRRDGTLVTVKPFSEEHEYEKAPVNKTSKNLSSKTHIDKESLHEGPVDLDDILHYYAIDGVNDDGTFFADVGDQTAEVAWEDAHRFFNNPNQRLLDVDASHIPGSPFSKPAIRPSNRPREPLPIARYASSLSFLGTFATVAFLFFTAIDTYADNIGRIIVELILSLLLFFGLFWNIYLTVRTAAF